jgi:hypothetical protein
MLRDTKARSARRRREIAKRGWLQRAGKLSARCPNAHQYLETGEHRDTEIEETIAALAREPGRTLADPGNEIPNAKGSCSRYIILECAAMLGGFKRRTI